MPKLSIKRLLHTAVGAYAHAEGTGTQANGPASHAEGDTTTASALGSYAEGLDTQSTSMSTHAEGSGSVASGRFAHAGGLQTVACGKSSHVFGEYNVADGNQHEYERGSYVEIVGNGTADNARSNARTLDWAGNDVYCQQQLSRMVTRN